MLSRSLFCLCLCLKSLSKASQKSLKSLSKVSQKSLKSHSKVSQKSKGEYFTRPIVRQPTFVIFLAVQDSSIGDLVNEWVGQTFDFSWETFARLLRGFWETFERLLRHFWEIFERLLGDFYETFERLSRDVYETFERLSWRWGVVIYNQMVTWTAFANLAMFNLTFFRALQFLSHLGPAQVIAWAVGPLRKGSLFEWRMGRLVFSGVVWLIPFKQWNV